MKKTHFIGPEYLDLDQIQALVKAGGHLALSAEATGRLERCRAYLEGRLAQSDGLFYGINTGFGALCDIRISPEEAEDLQMNLVRSHACGVGDPTPPEVIRLMLLLKVHSLALGYSGVRPALLQRLVDHYNADLLPVTFDQGSLGASGDLAPLAHLTLPLVGLGEVWVEGRRRPAGEVLSAQGWAPLRLQAKEGLAMINGTQFSLAYGLWAMLQTVHWARVADLCAALSIDAFHCRQEPYSERVQALRPHPGQAAAAAAIRGWLAGSGLAELQSTQVQDPYAFRCVPQVHGASADAITHIRQMLLTEANSVTDNPGIFPEDDLILSGGNFHAQPIALAMDYLAIALAELGSISERRTYQLLSGQRGLPPFLSPRPGLHSGLMISQYTAAALVSQNKQLCSPASVDSIVSSNGQEDHVSMAANAGTKLYRVVNNLRHLLAIEFMAGAQAMDYRRPRLCSPALEEILAAYRQQVPPLTADRVLSSDVLTTVEFLQTLPA